MAATHEEIARDITIALIQSNQNILGSSGNGETEQSLRTAADWGQAYKDILQIVLKAKPKSSEYAASL